MCCCFLFLLVLTPTLLLANAAEQQEQMQGFVGESVTFHCKKPPSTSYRLYVQKESDRKEIFINGFDITRTLPETIYMNRTKVNESEFSMEFYNLTLADTGIYKCFAFTNILSPTETKFKLTIAAKYSTPNITAQQCKPGSAPHGEAKCQITCTSSGGFPLSNVTWVPSIASLQVEKEDHMPDKDTGFYHVSQTVLLNCSQTNNISCSVGGVESETIDVCTPPPVGPSDKVLPIAFGLLLLVIGLIIAFVLITRRRRMPPQEETGQEMESLNSPEG